MNFFQDCQTSNEIKALYRQLVFKYHPDVGGDLETMKTLNAEYHAALEAAHGQTAKGSDGKDHTYYYNEVVEQAIMDKINELLALNLPADVNILLVGTWIWVEGETRPIKDQLKSAGLKWNRNRQRWFFHTGKGRRRYNKNASFGDLQNSYGSTKYQKSQTKRDELAA